jgi:hypothetical protein
MCVSVGVLFVFVFILGAITGALLKSAFSRQDREYVAYLKQRVLDHREFMEVVKRLESKYKGE